MNHCNNSEYQRAYEIAQRAISDLKAAVRLLLSVGPVEGMRNVEIGHALGIYQGHVGHEGHISRSLLAALQTEGVANQNPETKRWVLCHFASVIDEERHEDS